tara:strand:+ start:449 stop:1918 length:1470 start_codon:yes stop_codon:yes gene_type:complete
MSKILNILEGEDKDFRYYSAKGHASTPLEFGQKSIPYGMDQQGGGSSKQPYIERTQGRLSFSIEELTNSLVDINKQQSAIIDLERMTKWFTTPLSQGILFNAKQVHQSNLQERSYQYSIGADLNTNPKQILKTSLSNLVDSIGNGLVNTNHILKQVGGDGFNLRFDNPLTSQYRLLENNPGETGNNTNGFRNTNGVGLNPDVQGRSNYGEFNRTKTYKQGNPGQPRLNRTDPFGEGITDDNQPTTLDASNAPTVDKVSFQSLYKSREVKNEIAILDTVPFYITVMDNDNQDDNVHIHFRAFLDSFSDSFAADWQTHRFMGRGENFYTYGGQNRSINTSFKVHAQSKQELVPMYNKLNYLASSLSPDYNQGGFMRGNFIKLTIGDYMVDMPGILTSLTLDIPTNYPWDIGRNKDGKKEDDSLPMIINVSSFQFTPVYNFIPQKLDINDFGDIVGSKFINNSTTVDTSTSNQDFTMNYIPSANRYVKPQNE